MADRAHGATHSTGRGPVRSLRSRVGVEGRRRRQPRFDVLEGRTLLASHLIYDAKVTPSYYHSGADIDPPAGDPLLWGKIQVIGGLLVEIEANVNVSNTKPSTASLIASTGGPLGDIPFTFADSVALPASRPLKIVVPSAARGHGFSLSSESEISWSNGYTATIHSVTAKLKFRIADTDIAVKTAERVPESGDLRFTYSVTGVNLPSKVKFDFYWANGPSINDKLSEAAPRLELDGSIGTHGPITVPASSLASRPASATHLLVVADEPNHVINETSEENNVKGAPWDDGTTNFAIKSMEWHKLTFDASGAIRDESGGVEITYVGTDSSPARAATLELFWAKEEAGGVVPIGSPVHVVTVSPSLNPGQLRVSAADLDLPARGVGVSRLLAVLNRERNPIETRFDDNQVTLRVDPAAIAADSDTFKGSADVGNFIAVARFRPLGGALTLEQAAALYDVDHFNFINELIEAPVDLRFMKKRFLDLTIQELYPNRKTTVLTPAYIDPPVDEAEYLYYLQKSPTSLSEILTDPDLVDTLPYYYKDVPKPLNSHTYQDEILKDSQGHGRVLTFTDGAVMYRPFIAGGSALRRFRTRVVGVLVAGQPIWSELDVPIAVRWNTTVTVGDHQNPTGAVTFARRDLSFGPHPTDGAVYGITPEGAASEPIGLEPTGTVVIDEGSSGNARLQGLGPAPAGGFRYGFVRPTAGGPALDAETGLATWTAADGPLTGEWLVGVIADPSLGFADVQIVRFEVRNVAPTVAAGGDEAGRSGIAFRRAGSFADPGTDAWTAVVDYGDGSGEQGLALGPDKTFSLEHAFRAAGRYTVTVRISDDDGGLGQSSFVIDVAPSGPPLRFVGFRAESKRGTLTALRFALDGQAIGNPALAPNGFRLVSAGRDRIFGTKDDKTLKVKPIIYDPLARRFTVTPSVKVTINQPLRLLVDLGTGVKDADGRQVDGDGDGKPGGVYQAQFGAKAKPSKPGNRK